MAKIITSPYLFGIQTCNNTNLNKIKGVLRNIDYKRERQLSFLSFSDSHGNIEDGEYIGKSGKEIGSVYSIAKLSYKSFNSLKMALADPETRIIESVSDFNYPIIIGAAIKNQTITNVIDKNDYSLVHFNSEMNCIIGARGTGKSTLLEFIQYIIMPKKEKNQNKMSIAERFDDGIVCIRYGGKIFGIYCNPVRKFDDYTGDVIEFGKYMIYTLNSKGNFNRAKQDELDFLKNFLTMGYKQRQLYEYSKNPEMIIDIVDDFISWKKSDEYEKYTSQIKRNMSKLKEILSYRTDKLLVEYATDNGYIDEIRKLHFLILKSKNQLYKLRKSMIEELNELLKGKVKLEISKFVAKPDFEYLTENLPYMVSYNVKKYYEYETNLKQFINRIVRFTIIKDDFNFFSLLLDNNISEVINTYNLSKVNNKLEYLADLRKYMTRDCLLVFLEDKINMEYNINSGLNTSHQKFRKNFNLSLGQNAVALLLLVLNAAHNLKDDRPLIMDQPEDDLDNSYIFNTLVTEFRESKNHRQLIISTHNANIPVASDAENILVLKYNGEAGYIDINGSIDHPKVTKEILDILEGGRDAIKARNSKYML